MQENPACIALPRSLHADVLCDRKPRICTFESTCHGWTPVAGVDCGCLLLCVYMSHTGTTSQPTHPPWRDDRRKNEQRETEMSVSSVRWGRRPKSFGPSLTAAAVWHREVVAEVCQIWGLTVCISDKVGCKAFCHVPLWAHLELETLGAGREAACRVWSTLSCAI